MQLVTKYNYSEKRIEKILKEHIDKCGVKRRFIMGAVILVLIIWSIIAFIVSKVKGGGFWEACKIMLLGIFKEATSSSSGTSAAIKEARRKAERAGRDDIVDAIDKKQATMEDMHNQYTQMYNNANRSNNDDDNL